jgi:hypothetical protein
MYLVFPPVKSALFSQASRSSDRRGALRTSGLLRLVHYMALYLRLLALVGYVPTAVGKTDTCVGPLALGRQGVFLTTWEH